MGCMGKGGTARANLRTTRAQINNARSSAQGRAFRAREAAKQKRDAEARALRAKQEAEKEKKPEPDTGAPESAESPPEE